MIREADDWEALLERAARKRVKDGREPTIEAARVGAIEADAPQAGGELHRGLENVEVRRRWKKAKKAAIAA